MKELTLTFTEEEYLVWHGRALKMLRLQSTSNTTGPVTNVVRENFWNPGTCERRIVQL